VKGWLLDTNVVSELRKPSATTHVEIWIDAQPRDSLFLSVVSFAELRFGIERARNDLHRRELVRWLETDLRGWFATTTVGLDEDALLAWRKMIEATRTIGRPVGEPDLLIAAIAKRQDFCVATRNSLEFAQAGVPVFNPWDNVLKMPGRRATKLNGVVTLDRLP
jgi:predicted nucleic acid-binding protein